MSKDAIGDSVSADEGNGGTVVSHLSRSRHGRRDPVIVRTTRLQGRDSGPPSGPRSRRYPRRWTMGLIELT